MNGVGKSSLISRIINNSFTENGQPVTTASLYIEKYSVNFGAKKIKFSIMDTPGEDSIMTASTLSRQSFVFLVYDVNDKASFEAMETFVENFNHGNTNPHKLLIIVGNKNDH